MTKFTKNTSSVTISTDSMEEITVYPNNYPTVFIDSNRVLLKFEGEFIILKPTDSIQFDGVGFSGTLADLKAAVVSVFPSTNSGSGGSGGGVTIGGTYDSEAEASAALGTGKLYKSSTSINGSPIILITSGTNSDVGGVYDNNGDAVAAIGTGKLYKSSTLINGSSIILLTV
jgi:hypothetical protein